MFIRQERVNAERAELERLIRRIVRIPLHAEFVCPLCGAWPVRIALPGARA